MRIRQKLAAFAIALSAAAASCGRPPDRTDQRVDTAAGIQVAADAQAAADPAGGAEGSACAKLMDEMRSLRGGPQPCASQEDCTVWHNGEYWDGCPPEVNRTNAEKLDAMRKAIEAAGCAVETNANCAPRIVNGCQSGECGASPAFTLKLTEKQKADYEADIAKVPRAATADPAVGKVGGN